MVKPDVKQVGGEVVNSNERAQAQVLLRAIRTHVGCLRELARNVGDLGTSGTQWRPSSRESDLGEGLGGIFGHTPDYGIFDLPTKPACPICAHPTTEAHARGCWVGESAARFAHEAGVFEALAGEIEAWLDETGPKPDLLGAMTMLVEWTAEKLEEKD